MGWVVIRCGWVIVSGGAGLIGYQGGREAVAASGLSCANEGGARALVRFLGASYLA